VTAPPPKVSLAQQIEAVRFAETRQRTIAGGGSVKSARPRSVEDYDLQRLNAAARTLEWLKEHETAIRAFLACRPTSRDAALAMAQEIERRQVIAANGGPAR
jgi:hypothetical protein